jgi:hypothetical protein
MANKDGHNLFFDKVVDFLQQRETQSYSSIIPFLLAWNSAFCIPVTIVPQSCNHSVPSRMASFDIGGGIHVTDRQTSRQSVGSCRVGLQKGNVKTVKKTGIDPNR